MPFIDSKQITTVNELSNVNIVDYDINDQITIMLKLHEIVFNSLSLRLKSYDTGIYIVRENN